MKHDAGGSYPSILDDKGRVNIPKSLRDLYNGELVITMGLRACARIMRPEVWDLIHERLTGSNGLTEDEQELVELQLIAPRMIIEVDQAGRIAIPPVIRRYARLTKNCLILNLENRLEVWDEELYFAHLDENRAAIKEAIRKMGSLKLFKLDT
ncbi:MAG: division/cell wall cluster transcriptional repressor MraZ [Treponema sp.]|jgi:MraZ protein|nr:division/cell wall cluster transcriptional repressor MraZ [Treponema sp.]